MYIRLYIIGIFDPWLVDQKGFSISKKAFSVFMIFQIGWAESKSSNMKKNRTLKLKHFELNWEVESKSSWINPYIYQSWSISCTSRIFPLKIITYLFLKKYETYKKRHMVLSKPEWIIYCIEVLNFRDNNNTGVLEILNSSYLDFDDPISKIEMNIFYFPMLHTFLD